MALETFVDLYKDYREALEIRDRATKNPFGVNEYYGRTANLAEKVQGIRPPFNPDTQPQVVRLTVDSNLSTLSRQTNEYAENNLESIVSDVNNEKLGELLLNTNPRDVGYDDIRKLHEEYLLKAKIPQYLKSKDEEQRNIGMQSLALMGKEIINKKLTEHNKSLAPERQLKQEEIEMITNALQYSGYFLTKDYIGDALRICEDDAEKALGNLKAKSNDVKAYLAKTIRASEDKDKAVFYEALYNAGKKENKEG